MRTHFPSRYFLKCKTAELQPYFITLNFCISVIWLSICRSSAFDETRVRNFIIEFFIVCVPSLLETFGNIRRNSGKFGSIRDSIHVLGARCWNDVNWFLQNTIFFIFRYKITFVETVSVRVANFLVSPLEFILSIYLNLTHTCFFFQPMRSRLNGVIILT